MPEHHRRLPGDPHVELIVEGGPEPRPRRGAAPHEGVEDGARLQLADVGVARDRPSLDPPAFLEAPGCSGEGLYASDGVAARAAIAAASSVAERPHAFARSGCGAPRSASAFRWKIAARSSSESPSSSVIARATLVALLAPSGGEHVRVGAEEDALGAEDVEGAREDRRQARVVGLGLDPSVRGGGVRDDVGALGPGDQGLAEEARSEVRHAEGRAGMAIGGGDHLERIRVPQVVGPRQAEQVLELDDEDAAVDVGHAATCSSRTSSTGRAASSSRW